MDKITPDPPIPPVTPSMDNAFTRDLLKDRAALYRALDHYLPDANPTSPDAMRFYNVSKDVSIEDTMLYTADLLRCASVTAYECGEHFKGTERPWPSPCGTCWKSPKPWSTSPSNTCGRVPSHNKNASTASACWRYL